MLPTLFAVVILGRVLLFALAIYTTNSPILFFQLSQLFSIQMVSYKLFTAKLWILFKCDRVLN
jgi:hypothetical protein